MEILNLMYYKHCFIFQGRTAYSTERREFDSWPDPDPVLNFVIHYIKSPIKIVLIKKILSNVAANENFKISLLHIRVFLYLKLFVQNLSS